MATSNSLWGTDGKVSMPQPIKDTDIAMVDFGGFCFTPDGIRSNLSIADHERLLSEGFTPAVPSE